VTLLVVTIVVALAFDFTNGFHDTANAVATSVSTRALSPRLAVLIAAIANLAGAFVTTAVAKTVGQGIIDSGLANSRTVLAAVSGAIVWNVIPALWAPTTAFVAAFGLLLLIYWVFQWMTPGLANRSFRIGQLLTGTWVAFTHGANDAQKTMGVIALALFAHGSITTFYIPTWVKIAAGLSIAAGTYAGGWRIMRTLGQRVFQIDPPAGFAAQAASGAVIYASTKYGYPLSTTHVVSGAVMGAGATKRLSAVRWGVAGNIVVAWMLTIPAAALVSAAAWYPVKAIF
jgi:PiT family inorganic phosphate transporter